jgi:4-alpha-glucanotransferase
VRYPAEDLLAIGALESHRAGAVVVGEDLGSVEPRARRQLLGADVLSYRLVWFEGRRPARYPRRSLAAVTTHDLPTVAGPWTGADLQAQRALGLRPNEPAFQAIRARLRAMTGLPEDAPAAAAILGAHRLLARAPSVLVSATLEDALAVEERPNMPATAAAQRPNWRLPLPVSLEALETHAFPRTIGRLFRQARPARERARRDPVAR